jgi:hypothetical protein
MEIKSKPSTMVHVIDFLKEEKELDKEPKKADKFDDKSFLDLIKNLLNK